MSDPIVGIDLGTSNSVVSYAEPSGSVRVLSDEAGYKIHPSVVSFHPNGGVVVGASAKQRKVIDPKNTIYSIKRLIGRSFDSPEVQTARTRSPFEIVEGSNHQPLIKTRAGDYAVPEISAIVLDHMRAVAANALATEVKRAVVTVPAAFNDAQRSATATAGSIANLNVVRVLNEPTAAALAYGHTRQLHQVIAVYDFGGGTFDITILKLADQVYEVLGTAGDTFLGGDDLDEKLVDRMVEKFLSETRVDLRNNEVSMMRLRAVAEQTKIELSRRSRAVVRIDEIAYGAKGKPLDLQIEISRDEFVRMIGPIVDRTFPVCQEALKYAKLGPEKIDDVILVGGTTKVPYVRDEVTKFFRRAPRTDVNPEDAVALGAGLQALALDRALARQPSRAPTPSGTTSIGSTIISQDTQAETMLVGGDSLVGLGAVTQLGGPTGIGGDSQLGGDSSVVATTVAGALDLAPDLEPLSLELDDLPGAQQHLDVTAREPGGPRGTQSYPDARRLATERPAGPGHVVDHFEERTPPPVSPTTMPIGRITKGPAPAAAPVQAPPTPRPPPYANPNATLMGVPIPAVAPPVPARPRGTSSPPPIPQRAKPPTSPHDVATVMIAPEVSPGSTAKGFAAAPAAAPPVFTPAAPVPPPPPAYVPPAHAQPTMIAHAPPTMAASAQPTMIAPAQPTMIAPAQPTMMAPARTMAPVVLDVTPRGLGIGTIAGFCEELIHRNSRLPAEIRKVFTTVRDHQDSVRIVVVQGESRRIEANVVLGDLTLSELPLRPRGETSIEVTFTLDASGILQVRARDSQTGREQRASLDLVGAMPESEVEASRDRLTALRR